MKKKESSKKHYHCQATQILNNRKSISLYHSRNTKIVQSRTFDLKNYTRKYMKIHQMAKNKPCNNLYTSRTPQWPININFQIGLVPQEFYFRDIWLFWIFQILDFFSSWCAKLWNCNLQIPISEYFQSTNLIIADHHDLDSVLPIPSYRKKL